MTNVDSARTRSPWIESSHGRRFPTLEKEINVDVAIVGAGITGVTAGEILKKAGKTVALIDLHKVGGGETGHTTAHLTEVLDTDFATLIANFGIKRAQLACESNRRAIRHIENTVLLNGIQCDFERVCGWKFSQSASDISYLDDEAEAALQLNIPNTVTTESPLPFAIEHAIRFDNQAQFHPVKYVNALANMINGDGSYVFERTRAIDVEEGEHCKLICEHGAINAKDVIIAANVPILNRFLLITKIAAYRTYVVAFPKQGDWESEQLFWDTNEPYHYIRSQTFDGRDYIIVGGEDHKTGQDEHTECHFQKLEQWSRKRFRFDAVTYRWSGQIINSVDGLPFIGRNALSEHVYVATGFMGNGMTFGTVAGMMIADSILGIANPWLDLYNATRVKPFASAKSYLAENSDFPAKMIADRITPAQESDLNAIREDEGALVRVGGKKVAAYRDPGGQLHLLSPVCPHLGCYVHWNEAEKSWDCPCHGSRFDPVGKLLNGPAVSDLKSEVREEDYPFAPVRYEAGNRPDPFRPSDLDTVW